MFEAGSVWDRPRLVREALPVLLVVSLALSIVATASASDLSLAGRHRVELRVGYWDSGRQQGQLAAVATEDLTRIENMLVGFSYAYWVHDRLATFATVRGLVAEARSVESVSRKSESATVVTSAVFGIRLYPISSARAPVRPYLTAGLGPYIGVESHKVIDNGKTENVKTLGSFGGYLGGGLDIQMGRYVMFGVQAGYNLMADFPGPLAYENNYSGIELSAGISLLLGKGTR